MGPQRTQIPSAPAALEPAPAAFAAEPTDNSLAESLAALRKRKWVLVAAALLGIIFGTYKALNQPKLYQAISTIQVRSGSSNEYKVSASYTGDPSLKINTELQILKSDSLMMTVARELDLANNPDFFGQVPGVRLSLDQGWVRQAMIYNLQQNLTVALVPKTEMVRISFVGSNAKLSADIVNQVVKDYIQRSYETRFASTQRVSQWLSGQLDDLKQQVETTQEQMMDLQRRLGVVGGSDPKNSQSLTTTSVEELLAAEGTAKIQRITAESHYRMLTDMDADTVGSSVDLTPMTNTGAFSSVRAQIATLKAQYAQQTADRGLGPNHPIAKALAAQIAELTGQLALEQNRLLLQAKETFLAAQATEAATESALEGKKAELFKQRDDLVELTLRQREYEQARTLYEGLEEKLKTAGVQSGLESLEIDVVDPALPPAYPVLIAKSTIIGSNTLFFLLGGIVLAFILESLDTGISNIAQIERLMELPSLAVIPRAKRASTDQTAAMSTAQRNINVLTQPKSQFTEAFRSLRTSLLLATVGRTPKFILFTSATPSEGKTTTASNLACVLAQRDTSVLLIDADLRRPNVHHRFGLPGKVGLTTLLAGTTTLEQSLQHIPEVPNLDILPSGPVPPFPTEMLGSDAMMALLERLGKLYTHVVIDSPPILSVTDGVILARVVDSVVLVIRHGKSGKNVIRRARDLLVRSGAPVAGIVPERGRYQLAGVLRLLRILGLLLLERRHRHLGYRDRRRCQWIGKGTGRPRLTMIGSTSERNSIHGKDASLRPRRFVATLGTILLLALTVLAGSVANAQGGAGSAGQPSGGSSAANPSGASLSSGILFPGDDFILGSGDLLIVRLFGFTEYNTTVRIGRDGTVVLPYIGSVAVEGISIRDAEALIANKLRAGGYYRDPEILIQVSESLNSSVTVTGEVKKVIQVSTGRRLIDVLADIGGLPVAASHTIKIIRAGTAQPITVDLGTDMMDSDQASMMIYPRDIIEIGRAYQVFVLGAFRSQGGVAFDQSKPLTLMQLTALNGGTLYEARNDDLRIIRTTGNERKYVKVDIKKIINGKAPDPVLAPNDIVFLPTNQLKALIKQIGVGGAISYALLAFQFRN